jgi:hypothetical protein
METMTKIVGKGSDGSSSGEELGVGVGAGEGADVWLSLI